MVVLVPPTNPWDDFQSSATPSAPPQAPPTANPWDDFKASDTPKAKSDMFDTVSDNAVEGATFGLGNRAEAGLAALALSAMNNKGLGQNYKDAYAQARAKLGTEMQEHPVASIASNLAGGLSIGDLGASTGAGSAIANSLRTGNLGARVAKGAALGSATGAAYGAGTAEDGKALQGAEQGAATGAVTGGAFPVAGAALADVGNTALNAVKGAFAKSPEAVQNAAQGLKQGASDLYDKMRQVGATLNNKSGQGLSNSIDTALQKNKFIPGLNQGTVAIVDDLKNAISNGNLGIDDLDQYRRLLGRVGGSEDGVSAGNVKRAIDDYVNGLTSQDLSHGHPVAADFLNQGRQQYVQASKFEDIADILTKADGDPNKIKSGLTRFMNNENNTRGWTGAELDALKNAASSGTTEKLLKMGGKFGFDLGTSTTSGNTVAPIVGGAAATLAGGPIGGIVAPIAGTAARIGQKLTARGKAQSLLNTIEKGPSGSVTPQLPAKAAGLGQILPSPMLNQSQSQQVQQPVTQQQLAPAQPMGYETTQPELANSPANGLPDISSFEKAESGGNPNAKNPNSSASGLLQFTNKTWANMVAKYGQDTGINLSNKSSPQAQRVMAALLARDNAQSLQKTIGRMPDKGELYMAHVLGASGAAKLINADPNKEGILLFPRQVFDANHNIFFNQGRPRTAGEVYQILANKVA